LDDYRSVYSACRHQLSWSCARGISSRGGWRRSAKDGHGLMFNLAAMVASSQHWRRAGVINVVGSNWS
jgi:hypothetical protein